MCVKKCYYSIVNFCYQVDQFVLWYHLIILCFTDLKPTVLPITEESMLKSNNIIIYFLLQFCPHFVWYFWKILCQECSCIYELIFNIIKCPPSLIILLDLQSFVSNIDTSASASLTIRVLVIYLYIILVFNFFALF